MKYKITVPGRGPGSRFMTDHGVVEIDARGHAVASDAQRAHLERAYGATFEPIVDGDIALSEISVVEREPTPGEIAARANIEANRQAADEAAANAQRVPSQTRGKRKRP